MGLLAKVARLSDTYSKGAESPCQAGVVSLASDADGATKAVGDLSSPLTEAVRIWINSLYLSNSSQNAENQSRKCSRFLVRAFRGVGVGVARGFRFRWFVLTESNEAIEAGLDFGKAFHKLVTWLRYQCPDFQYVAVEHWTPRRHWHLITYGSDKLPCMAIRSWWLSHYLSTISGMAEVRSVEKAMYYVCGYLRRGGKLTRSWCSRGWVFSGWLGFSKEYFARYGEYPAGEIFTELALSNKAKRDYEVEWLRETGYMSRLYLEDEVADDGLRDY